MGKKNFASLFMILLVIALPFSSASAMAASVSVTKNSGSDGIEDYINGNGDTWTVEATLTGTDKNVDPASVSLVLGGNKEPFNACTSTPSGVVCTYSSPLPNGVSEGSYEFKVIYDYFDQENKPQEISSVPRLIISDGSAPLIFFKKGDVFQSKDKQIIIDFAITDKVISKDLAVGLKEVRIVDGNNKLIESISDFKGKEISFNYIKDGKTGGKLPHSFTGEGNQILKVVAVDRFGNTRTSSPVNLFVDFVAPIVKDANFTDIGKFIGTIPLDTSLDVFFVESGFLNPESVTISSPQANLDKTSPDKCVKPNPKEEDLWQCTWFNVEVKPQDKIVLTINVEDGKENKVEKVITKTLVKDSTPPTVEFFGTEQLYEDFSYISSQNFQNKIFAVINEQGGGIDVDTGITANLLELSSGKNKKPNKCSSIPESSSIVCEWNVGKPVSSDSVRINLDRLEDKAGNLGELRQVDIKVDGVKPIVKEVGLYALDGAAQRDYFQSGDKVAVFLVVEEASGLKVLVDLNEIVNNPELKYPAEKLIDGWLMFTEEDCKLDGTDWLCALKFEELRSGPASGVDMEIKVFDTAGNLAEEFPDTNNITNLVDEGDGSYSFDILELKDEKNPDYWESKPTTASGFINVDNTNLISARITANLKLSSKGSAIARDITATCAPDKDGDPKLSRVLVYGGSSNSIGTASPRLVLEFEPFDGREEFSSQIDAEEEIKLKYKCQLQILSQVDEKAIGNAEVEEVEITVPFGFTTLGGNQENIDNKTQEARNSAFTDMALVVKDINNVMETIQLWSAIIIKPLNLLVKIIDGIKIGMQAGQDYPPTYAILTGACIKSSAGQKVAQENIDWLTVPSQLLSCNPSGLSTLGLDGYAQWQQTVLDAYNTWVNSWFNNINAKKPSGLAKVTSFAGYTPRHVKSLRDNILISTIGICLPGIVENLDRLGQAQCRYIYCLENEVPQGIPVDTCEQMKSQLICKYVLGQVVGSMPVFTQLDLIGKTLKSMVTDPLSFIVNGLGYLCTSTCPTSTAASGGCSILTLVTTFFDQWSSITSALDRLETTDDDFCSRIDPDEDEKEDDKKEDKADDKEEDTDAT